MSESGTSNVDGNDLIVAFPSSSSDSEGKQVRFSEYIYVHSFPYSPSKRSLDAGTPRGTNSYSNKNWQGSSRHSRLLSTTPMKTLEKEVLYRCLGLEALVSNQFTRFLKEMKEDYSSSKVELQYRLTDEQLTAYAMSHSLQ